MGNENERKRDPAENRENRMGGGPDEAKTGGDEKNVGLTGTTGGAAGGPSVGSGGAIGGSSGFLSGESEERASSDAQGGSTTDDQEIGSGTKQVLTGETGNEMFSGQPQSGTSFIAGNNSRADLGASGAGSPESQPSSESDEPQIAPGGQSEIGGASDLGGGETGLGDHPGFIGSNSGDDGGDYLREDGNPDSGFAEQGRGAPDGSEPIGPEGTPERTANRDSDIEGSSKR